MPHQEIPNYDDTLRDHHPSDMSSLSSGSSGRNSRVYSFSSQNVSDSDSGQNLDHQLVAQNRFEREIERELLHGNAPLVYHPVVLPAEPSLEELLRQVAGTAALHTVTEIQLRVISYMFSLQRIPIFCPNLRALNLAGSVVGSLRDLGTDLRQLVYLNVSRCGLRNLDGTNGLGHLEELVADNNEIEETGPCTNLANIKKISLKGNGIRTVGAVSFLALCDTLTMLDLLDNPVAATENYREGVKENIPQLAVLDGHPLGLPEPEHSELSSSEYKSSTTSEEIPKHWKEPEKIEESTWPKTERPTTAGGERSTEHIQLFRPSTADQSGRSRLKISGEPIVGNLLRHVRRNRKPRQAWTDSTSSISSSDASEAGGKLNQTFPNRLQQEPVELELGLLGNQPDLNLTDDNVMEAARTWRRRSQLNREKIRSDEMACSNKDETDE